MNLLVDQDSAAGADIPRVLLLGIGAADAARFTTALMAQGLEVESRHVEDAVGLRGALEQCQPDLIVSDAAIPGFALESLELLRAECGFTPLLLVAGRIDEGEGIEAVRRGAADYVLKHDLSRFLSSVQRALHEAEVARGIRNAELERQREERYGQLALLANGLSHDLRNILQPLMLVSAVLKKNPAEDVRSLAEMIDNSSQRGLAMVSALLGFTQGQPAPAGMSSVAKLMNAVRIRMPGGMPKGIAVEIAPQASELQVGGDVAELQQCLLNLCLNSVQAMAGEGRLEILAQREQLGARFFAADEPVLPGAYIRIGVCDSGHGIPESVWPNLFKPFFTTRKNATGLGLLTCQRIAAAHRGVIRIESQPGQGTRVDLYLPDSSAAPAEAG